MQGYFGGPNVITYDLKSRETFLAAQNKRDSSMRRIQPALIGFEDGEGS